MIRFFDTCSLLNHQKEIFNDKDIFYISNITINELENIKSSGTKDEETKYNARILLHELKNNKDRYIIVLYKNEYLERISNLDLPNSPDSKIISSAYCYFKDNNLFEEGYFITDDLACEAIANAIGLKTLMAIEKKDNYSGCLEQQCSDDILANFYSNILINNINTFDLLENQYLILKNSNNEIVDKYKWHNNQYIKIQFQKADSKIFGKVIPKDDYQQLALDTLSSNKISMLRGFAGSGKTFIAFGHMFSLLEKGKIDRIIIFCNTVATKGSARLGFYPGSRLEKLLDSQIGNLLESKLGGDRMIIDKLIDMGQLIILPMSDIRGYDTSGMNAAVYISEAQNLDIELMRLALQRIGEDSICILDGDDNAQVDLSMYAGNNNGMKRVSKVFRGNDIYGEVTLKNIHRSKIAELAQKM